MVVVSHLFLLCAECGTNLTGESSSHGCLPLSVVNHKLISVMLKTKEVME